MLHLTDNNKYLIMTFVILKPVNNVTLSSAS